MRITILLSCPDRRGIVSCVAQFIERQGGNIVESMQHNAVDAGVFFMRVEWDWEPPSSIANAASSANRPSPAASKRAPLTPSLLTQHKSEIDAAFAEAVTSFEMSYEIWIAEERPRVGVMVSRHLHCLYDLLLQWHEAKGEAIYDLACVISNHADARGICDWVGVPFYHIAVEKERKAEAEREQLSVLRECAVDTVVLARYMQILSSDFVGCYPHQIINIHHSFLPAFVGGHPYRQAYERGVKIVGATSHYVTAALDQGPIIEQDVQRISHSNTIEDITNIGKNLERIVLSHAVRLHLQRRVYVHRNKTIVFR